MRGNLDTSRILWLELELSNTVCVFGVMHLYMYLYFNLSSLYFNSGLDSEDSITFSTGLLRKGETEKSKDLKK